MVEAVHIKLANYKPIFFLAIGLNLYNISVQTLKDITMCVYVVSFVTS